MDIVEKRYIFDTNALNRICKDSNSEMLIYESKSNGFEYYFTEIQCKESSANISKVSDGVDALLVERSRAEFALDLLRIIPKLQTTYVSQIATLRPNAVRLDGTFDVLPNGETQSFDMFLDIVNENDCQYYNDGMIAMTAIVYGCILVTNDKRLYNKVNKHFPKRAIKFEEFTTLLEG